MRVTLISIISFFSLIAGAQASCGTSSGFSRISVGDTLLSTAGIPVTVRAVYSNGFITVKAPGARQASQPIPADSFALTRGCNNESYCVGDRLTSSIGVRARIAGLFQDGMVSIRVNRSNRFSGPVNPSDYFHESTPFGRTIGIGETLISSTGIPVTVVNVYANGFISVKAPGANRASRPIPAESFAVTRGCNNNHYCVGDQLTSRIGVNARIVGLYSNGHVSIRVNRSSRYSEPVDPRNYFCSL